MIVNGNLYELGTLSFIDFSSLQLNFETLPPDGYVERRLRSRRYSRYHYHHEGRLERLTQKDFMQTDDINKALGNVERQYQNIDKALEKDPIYLEIFKEFQSRTSLTEHSIIEAHQIRWHCRRNVKNPAPEGVHQDGFDFIGMFMVSSHNIGGGEVMLYESPDEAPCFSQALKTGEFMVLNDKKMFHNAAPLIPAANKEDGHWDLIVLTANQAH